MSSKFRVAADSTHITFRNTVFGFIREHEKTASINVACIIKYLCLEYYMLREQWTSCWAQYPLHWIYKEGERPQSDDWSHRTMFKVNEIVGYRPDSGHPIQAQIIRIKTNDNGTTAKLFLKFAFNTSHVPYGWFTIPNNRLCAPHLIEPPHFDGISGSVAVGAFDENVAEYRWSFKLWRSVPFTIGLRCRGKMIHDRVSLRDTYSSIVSFQRSDQLLKVGDVFHLVLDMIGQCARIEVEGNTLSKGAMCTIEKVPFTTKRISSRYQNGINWDSKGQYFVVIDHTDYSVRSIGTFTPNRKTDREFTVEHSNRIVKLMGFTIKQRNAEIVTPAPAQSWGCIVS